MANCETSKYVGKIVGLEFAYGCGNQLPSEGDWTRFPSMTTKGLETGWETEDVTTDDTSGYFAEQIATVQSFSISGEGICRRSGDKAAVLSELTKFVSNPATKNMDQPALWMRFIYPDITYTAFVVVTDLSRPSAGVNDAQTFTLAAEATSSDFGVIIEDTDSVITEPESVVIVPEEPEVNAGETVKLVAVVLPAEASQMVNWSTSASGIATVSPNGVVTGVAAGTADITATTTAGNKTATVEVVVN